MENNLCDLLPLCLSTFVVTGRLLTPASCCHLVREKLGKVLKHASSAHRKYNIGKKYIQFIGCIQLYLKCITNSENLQHIANKID